MQLQMKNNWSCDILLLSSTPEVLVLCPPNEIIIPLGKCPGDKALNLPNILSPLESRLIYSVLEITRFNHFLSQISLRSVKSFTDG